LRRAGDLKLISSTQEELFTRATAPEGDAGKMPAALLVFAHPDDETVALGARMGRLGAAHFVYVTDGAPRNEQDSRWHGFPSWREYREARADELRKMFSAAGISSATHECFDVPDQEASLQLVAITRRVADLIAVRHPEVIFTHPFEGGHPDHDACAFAVHHAVHLPGAGTESGPIIIEGAFYNALGSGPGSLLPRSDEVPQIEYRLTEEERQRKEARIDCFVSQRETLQGFPLEGERFRIAPAYEFRKPAHPPPLLYDRYPWGMTWERFVQLATTAEQMLHHER
jgi:LmbE family N-acetylglucosaminyl deacetylase